MEMQEDLLSTDTVKALYTCWPSVSTGNGCNNVVEQKRLVSTNNNTAIADFLSILTTFIFQGEKRTLMTVRYIEVHRHEYITTRWSRLSLENLNKLLFQSGLYSSKQYEDIHNPHGENPAVHEDLQMIHKP